MNSNTKAVVGWIGGILGTVISGFVLYYLTRTTPPQPDPAPIANSSPASPPSITIEGRVVDIAASKIIQNALVGLRAGAQSASQATDSNGCYLIEVDGLPDTTPATLTINAAGYPPYSLNKTLAQLRDAGDNELFPPSPDNAGGSSGNTQVSPGAGRAATLGAVTAKNPALRGATTVHIAPAGTAPAQVVTLPPYIRRVDAVKLTKAPGR
jgi:hypothetical protein